jgi:hypothetical protein
MSFDYQRLRDQTAEPLIERFGKSATLTTFQAASGGDPWNPVPDTPVTQDVTVVQTVFDLRDRDGTLVQEDDVMFLLSTAGDPTTDLAQTLTVESVVYQVVRIMPLKPGDITMLYKVQARK